MEKPTDARRDQAEVARARAKQGPMPALRHMRVWRLAGSRNSNADITRLLIEADRDLRLGVKLDDENAELIVGNCEPATGGWYSSKDTVVEVGDKVLSVFEKVHVLPYKDTFTYNYDHMYLEYIEPFFQDHQEGEFSEGFEFASKGVRFAVIGVLPDKAMGVAGKNTTVYYEGNPLERDVLEYLQLLPYEDGLPERYRPTKLSLDEGALLRDYVTPYFAQRSAVVKPSEVIEINDVRFKVVSCRPAAGGGAGKDTEFSCKGVALRKAFEPKAKSAAAPKAKPKAKPLAGSPGRPGASGTDGAAGREAGGQCLVS